MKIALFGVNMGPWVDPAVAARVARAAEAAGIESLWVGEHVVLPEPQAPPSPLPPTAPMLDPTVALTYLAAHTKTIRLGTGIIILPQRNPLVLAKELASLDVLSAGRLIFGVGIGYLKPEFDALGIPFEDKGPRTEEYLRAMIAIWSEEKPRFEGRFASFADVQAFPRPLQKPYPEIVFGGRTPAAFARTARLAKGWYGFALDLDGTKSALDGLRAACAKHGRDAAEIEISLTPPVERERLVLDADTAKRYTDLGVDRLIVYPARARDEAALMSALAEAEKLIR